MSKISFSMVKFSTTMSMKRVALGDSNNDRQPEIDAKTGNTYISENYDTQRRNSNGKSGIMASFMEV